MLVLGIIRTAKNLLPLHAVASLYKSKVRSVMEYCCPVWQGAPITSLNKLDIIQRKAIHCMGVHGDTIPSSHIFQLNERRIVSGGCQFYRMCHKVAPSTVYDLLPSLSNLERYSRSVTNSHHMQVSICRSKTSHHMSSFVPCFARLWNSLPSEVMYDSKGDVMKLDGFKKSLNRYLLTPR